MGGEPREGFVPLPAALRQPIAVDRAAQVLDESGRFAEVVALTEASPPRYAPWLRALALAQVGREDELLDALARAFALPGSEAGTEPLRELALQTLARRPLDEEKLAAFVQPGEGGRRSCSRSLSRASDDVVLVDFFLGA